MINSAFMLYAMECEGDLSTRTSKIEKFIKLLAASDNPNDPVTQYNICDQVGLDSNSFTEKEIKYIEEKTSKMI